MPDENGLHYEEDLEQIDEKRQKLVKQHEALLDENAYLIQWGHVVSSMLKEGKMDADEWELRCGKHLTGKALEIALVGLKQINSE